MVVGEINPLVSAIIPVFNGEDHIAQAIQSVRDQTYSPIECIVVDDGSTDRSAEVAEGFPGLIVLRRRNRGVSAARNEGARASTGQFVAFLDADDVWLHRKLELQMELFRRNVDLGLVYAGLTVVDEDLRPMYDVAAPPPDAALRNSVLLEMPVISLAQTGVIPRAVFDEVGGFDEDLSTSADTDLACRIACRHHVEGISDPLVLYQQHPGQMHRESRAMERDMLRVFEKLFSDPASQRHVGRLRRSAYANLYATIAAARWSEGARIESVGLAIRSLVSHPRGLARTFAARFAKS